MDFRRFSIWLVVCPLVTSLLITVFVPKFDLTKWLFRGESDR